MLQGPQVLLYMATPWVLKKCMNDKERTEGVIQKLENNVKMKKKKENFRMTGKDGWDVIQ